jgi:hypothetical protein
VGSEICAGCEPFLRLLRRTERSDSRVEGFASVLDEGLGLKGSADEVRSGMAGIL